MEQGIQLRESVLFRYNINADGIPISVKIDNENKQISPLHNTIQLEQIPDETQEIILLKNGTTRMTQVHNEDELSDTTFYIDYSKGLVKFTKANAGKATVINYYGKGVELIGASRIYDETSVNGETVIKTLQEIINVGKQYVEILGNVIDVKNKLEQMINESKQLKSDLETLNQDAKNTNIMLSNTNQVGTQINLTLNQTMAQASDDIAKINATGNKSLIIGGSQFVGNQYTWNHAMNNDNLVVNFIDSDTNEPLMPDYKILDKNNILIRNSVEHPNIKVVLSASYYQGNALFGTNVEEFAGDSIGIGDKKIRLKDGNGVVENPVTDSDAVYMTDGTTKLTKKISDIDASLEQNTKQLVPNFYDGAIVTFIDDDCYASVSKWIEIANNKGIKLSFAMVKDWVGTNGYYNIDEIKLLQVNGHDVLNHTKSHINNWDITNSEIIKEIEENIDYMKANGLNGYDVLVYPGTVPNESRYKTVTREKCRYGIANTYQSTNKVQDSFYMNRIDSDYRSLDQLKSIVDQAIIDKQWVLIMTHSWRPDGDVNSTGTFSVEKISQLIDYIKSKNVPILKFSEAEKYKGNSVAIGDYNNGVYIGKDGKNNLNYSNVINGSSLDKLAIEYPIDEITIETIRTPDDTLFNTGGVLITFRSSKANFTYQLYFLWDSNIVYKRLWKEYEKVWDNFERIDAVGIREKLENINDALIVNNNLENTSLMNAPITDYEVDKETIVIIRTPLDTFKGVGGIMKVFRSSQANFSYATFVPWNESAMYIRHWAENSHWGSDIPKWTPWVKMGA